MSRSIFKLTKNQQNGANYFVETHANNCSKISRENREFMETEEQATITSSYKYSFVDMGIADYTTISCCLCGEEKILQMSKWELDLI